MDDQGKTQMTNIQKKARTNEIDNTVDTVATDSSDQEITANLKIEELTIETTNTADTETTEESSSESPPIIETPSKNSAIRDMVNDWTPEENRDRRTNANKSKIQSTRGGTVPLFGGYFIANGRTNEVATLGFCFKGQDGNNYGLTSGHSFDEDDLVYAYSSNIPQNKRYPMTRIGKVEKINMATDSLIFKFDDGVKVELNTVRLSDDKKLVLDLSLIKNIYKEGDHVVGFGAQRRGTYGKIVNADWNPKNAFEEHNILKHGDVGIEDECSKEITHDGDCGAMYLIKSDHQWIPIAMHHAITRTRCDGGYKYRSWGVPLCLILKAYTQYFNVPVSTNIPREIGHFQSTGATPQGDALPPPRYMMSFSPGEEPPARKHVEVWRNIGKLKPHFIED